jgi:aminopeptidase N
MFKKLFIVLPAIVVFSCKTSQKTVQNNTHTINLDTMEVFANPQPPVYNPSRTKVFDIIHTTLDVRFDWEKRHLLGKANIVAKPYFYNTSLFELDAKGFDVHKVEVLSNNEYKSIDYVYDGKTIAIKLEKEYSSKDTITVQINYTAKPEERKSGGSRAISSDKGLYFINHDGKDSLKPMQIWTQGETESNSCWFPTIDSPNEKMTNEIYITVDKKHKTLSNGLLLSQTENEGGTRTDYWKQSLPHSPYLVMMAIGDFAIVKDKWRNVEVNYYVEKEYEPYAKAIFGNTPEMMEFFSKQLGVDYPWEKYHQVVVRDYVSGAMENTSAVIHGEFLQRTDRELLDATNEDVISHELYHHWFGDLTTCESWANLPLNESFATYGEYLWQEYKYGTESADHHLQQNLWAYLQEASRKQEDMIRYDYKDKEDMFDSHSYAKGGRILHMLRKHVGDEGFFASLKLYLTKNKFKPAEIHDLRLAFEEVTGEDLNWFFNQWFLASGHPDLLITYDYDENAKKQKVIIEQKQDFNKTPLYKLPVSIDIYNTKILKRHNVVITKAREEFAFDVTSKPDLVNFDAENMLLALKRDKKEDKQWVFQYYNAPMYMDRYDAVTRCSSLAKKDSLAAQVVIDAMADKYWNIRNTAIKSLKNVIDYSKEEIKQKLIFLAENDEKSTVRASAVDALSKYYDDKNLLSVYKNTANDKSYYVMGRSLSAIADINPEEGLQMAKKLENEKSSTVLSAVAEIYAEKGTDTESKFFEQGMDRVTGYSKINFLAAYGKYLKRDLSDETIDRGIKIFEEVGKNSAAFYNKLMAINALSGLEKECAKKEAGINQKISTLEKSNENPEKLQQLRADYERLKMRHSNITNVLAELNKKDENKMMIIDTEE